MTCTARRHTAGSYANGLCRCDRGRTDRRRKTKLRQAGLTQPYLVPAIGTRRRIEGLLAMGWTGAHIAAAAGALVQTNPSRVGARQQYVTQATADAVRRASAKLGVKLGPSDHTRKLAARYGYVSLWAWDDNIDDPAAQPQGALRPAKPMPQLTASAKSRFGQYRVPTIGGCARWTGPTDSNGGGRLTLPVGDRQSTVRAARVAYLLQHGRDPQGTLQRTCGNRWCVEGRHLTDDRLRAERQRKAAA